MSYDEVLELSSLDIVGPIFPCCYRCADEYTIAGMDCENCYCNVEGAVNQNCDKNDGMCTCVEGISHADAGFKCVSFCSYLVLLLYVMIGCITVKVGVESG